MCGRSVFGALGTGLARTPPMGWNPWNCFGVGRTGNCKLPLPWVPGHPQTTQGGGCHGFNESVIIAIAKEMVSPLRSVCSFRSGHVCAHARANGCTARQRTPGPTTCALDPWRRCCTRHRGASAGNRHMRRLGSFFTSLDRIVILDVYQV